MRGVVGVEAALSKAPSVQEIGPTGVLARAVWRGVVGVEAALSKAPSG